MWTPAIPSMFLAFLLLTLPALAGGSDTRSLETLRVAAEAGAADAQYELGVLYEFGYDFPDHKAAAYAWYSRAAEQGNALAARRRDALQPSLTPADVERARALANSPTAARSGR